MAKLKKLEPKPREAKYRLTLTRDEARCIQALAGRCANGSSPLRGVWRVLEAELGRGFPDPVDPGGRAIPAIHFKEN